MRRRAFSEARLSRHGSKCRANLRVWHGKFTIQRDGPLLGAGVFIMACAWVYLSWCVLGCAPVLAQVPLLVYGIKYPECGLFQRLFGSSSHYPVGATSTRKSHAVDVSHPSRLPLCAFVIFLLTYCCVSSLWAARLSVDCHLRHDSCRCGAGAYNNNNNSWAR